MAHFIITPRERLRKDGTLQLAVRYTYQGKHFKKAINNFYCKPSDFDKSSQLVTKGFDKEVLKFMNSQLNNIKLKGSQVIATHVEPVPDTFFDYIFKDQTTAIQKQEDIVSTFEEWESRLPVSHGSHKANRVTLSILKQFKTHRGGVLPVESFSHNFIDDFVNFMRDHCKGIEKNSTYQRHVKKLKQFGRYLTLTEKPINQNFREYKYNLKKISPVGINFDEFIQVFEADLSQNATLERDRDIWVLGTALGGLRHSSLQSIEVSDKYPDSLRFIDQKNSRIMHNPMNYFSRTIMEKFNWVMPDIIYSQKMNINLKQVAEKAKLERVEERFEYDDMKPIRTTIAVKDIFTTKSMRTCFTSSCMQLGIPREISDTLSGHITSGGASDYYRQVDYNLKIEAMQKWDSKYQEIKAKREGS